MKIKLLIILFFQLFFFNFILNANEIDIVSDNILQNPKLQSDAIEKKDLDLDLNNKEIDDKSNNFDLFNNKKERIIY